MNMKRTMILLPADTHKRLKHLAVEQETSLGHVIREAVEALIAEDREDISRAESVLKSFRPGTGTDYESYRLRRLRRGRNGG
jgi:predicted DNA-binding protein